MKTIAVWSFILIPLTVFAAYLGSTLTPETAALAMGAILGIAVAAVAILFGFLLRDERHRRQREEARRPAPRPQAPAPTYIDAAWRELPNAPAAEPIVIASRSPSPVVASRSAVPVIASRSPSPVIASRSGEAISPPAPTRALTRRS